MTTPPPRPGEPLQDRISARLNTMSRAERQVAEYLRAHGREAVFATAGQIAQAAGTSDATVVRTARTLGYGGLLELRLSLAQQVVAAATPTVPEPDAAPVPVTRTGSLLTHIFDEAAERLARTRRLLTEDGFDRAVALLGDASEVLCFGIGPSETVADYFALRLRRIGRRARATGATGFRLADDLLGLRAEDVAVLFSPVRLLGEIETVVGRAAEVGARTVLVTDSLGDLFTDRVDVVLPAAHSPGNLTGETVASQVLADALLIALSSDDKGRAVATSALMTSLRSELINGDSRQAVPHRRRGAAAAGGEA